MPKAIIDGKECTFEKGELLLQVAKRNGIEIPTLCHHEALPGLAACRLCICEVVERGMRKVVASCVYPLEMDCEVYTQSEKIRRERATILMLLKMRAPESERIDQLYREYGAVPTGRFKIHDGDKCILCGLCVKACNELGAGAIATINRGVTKEISTPYGEPNPVCIGCLSCAHICPTQAIAFEEHKESRTVWGKKFRVLSCRMCGAPIGTEEEMTYAADRAEEEDREFAHLCPSCRQKKAAKVFAEAFGIPPM